MIINSMGRFSCDNDDISDDAIDKDDAQIRDKRRCSSSTSSDTCVVLLDQSEFEPIQHPLEPPDEDRPVQCPMPPHSSLLTDGGMKNEQLQLIESLWRNAELPLEVNEEGMVAVAMEPPTRAVRKRHHTLTGDHSHPPLLRSMSLPPPRPSQSTTICRVLRQL